MLSSSISVKRFILYRNITAKENIKDGKNNIFDEVTRPIEMHRKKALKPSIIFACTKIFLIFFICLKKLNENKKTTILYLIKYFLEYIYKTIY